MGRYGWSRSYPTSNCGECCSSRRLERNEEEEKQKQGVMNLMTAQSNALPLWESLSEKARLPMTLNVIKEHICWESIWSGPSSGLALKNKLYCCCLYWTSHLKCFIEHLQVILEKKYIVQVTRLAGAQGWQWSERYNVQTSWYTS